MSSNLPSVGKRRLLFKTSVQLTITHVSKYLDHILSCVLVVSNKVSVYLGGTCACAIQSVSINSQELEANIMCLCLCDSSQELGRVSCVCVV